MASSLEPSDIQSVELNITKLWTASGVDMYVSENNPDYLNRIDGSLQQIDVEYSLQHGWTINWDTTKIQTPSVIVPDLSDAALARADLNFSETYASGVSRFEPVPDPSQDPYASGVAFWGAITVELGLNPDGVGHVFERTLSSGVVDYASGEGIYATGVSTYASDAVAYGSGSVVSTNGVPSGYETNGIFKLEAIALDTGGAEFYETVNVQVMNSDLLDQ